MNYFPSEVKEKLNSIIDDMSDHHWLFAKDPSRDFTRQNLGKLSFADTMKIIVSMGKGTTSDEIMDFFDLDPARIPSQSAFSQRRSQILPSAFEYLFSEFASSFPSTTNTFKGCCILACDGTHVVYDTNSQILEDFNKPRLEEHKGYNHLHLNGFVDVISKVFIDAVLQPGQMPNERGALRTMISHFTPDDPRKFIITADRGYESYDLIFQCELKSFYYVFRVKAPTSSRSILSSYIDELPDDEEEFDVLIKRFFTNKYTNIMKEQSDVYHYMNPTKTIPHFQELLDGKSLHFLQFRILKIKTGDGNHEYIITNLPFDFDINDVKECYHWRWGIEVTFRYLKHANGLLHFHAKKREFLEQEVFANLTLYNFSIFIANEAARQNKQKKRKSDNKYIYDVDISTAIRLSRKYLIRSLTKAIDVIQLMMKYVHAVKEHYRSFDRPLRGISAIRFGYR